jgi:integrase
MALKRMGFEGRLVSHGLRSLGSTTLNEHEFNPDIIEAALAHVDKNQVRSAYNRAEYIEKRRELMSWWSEHIEKASQGSLSISGTKHLAKVG